MTEHGAEGKLRLVVLASGRGSNLQAILESIAQGTLQAEVVGVISDKRDAFALKRAEEAGVTELFVNPMEMEDKSRYDKKLLEICGELAPHYICLAGYMRLLGQEFITGFKNRIINIHPSLLPAFPGLKAQEQALAYGVKVTGCTVHFVDEGMDTGPIIAQRAVPVLPQDDAASLSQRILEQEHQLYPQVLQLLQQGKINIKGRKVISK
ncbi:MAG: phosphoribosylglycinamide formyltransferase [Clostridia bacterium]|jgi:phosphoribosylglycinamide formyltransferase-1|nr:phosphoribosylglycinamide formyltransferase [Clostridia bacterium]